MKIKAKVMNEQNVNYNKISKNGEDAEEKEIKY